MSDKMRADVALVARGLAASREKAQALIMSGVVYLGETKVEKPSFMVGDSDALLVRSAGTGFVSRGALKLQKGLQVFPVDPAGRIAIDLGASTGGFTDVLLQAGAARVYAVDVGYGQLDWKLRNDPRVVVMERTNARYLTADTFQPRPSLAVMDVSFISITKILPTAKDILEENGEMITLIKPQFEAGRDRVGKKGVVRDASVHLSVLQEVTAAAAQEGWRLLGLDFSPIKGPEGNIEFLAHLSPVAGEAPMIDLAQVVARAHAALDA